eukprot:3432378-Rhodomonas_salina.1
MKLMEQAFGVSGNNVAVYDVEVQLTSEEACLVRAWPCAHTACDATHTHSFAMLHTRGFATHN